MKLLLKSVRLIDQNNKLNGKTIDLKIKNGKIEKIGTSLKADSNYREIKEKGLHISKGWIDLMADLSDPGFEHREDLQSGLKAAAAGGFTRIGVSPLVEPVRDSKSQIDYLKKAASESVVDPLIYASLSKGANGVELAEIYDLQSNGAIAFTDDLRSVKNPNLLKTALLYAKAGKALIMNFPYQNDLSPEGVMNEGQNSTALGLKGIPELAEELMVKRDLYLVEYTEGRMHFQSISSPRSIEMIDVARREGLEVSCDLPSYQLLLSDDELSEYDTRFKVMPPLRSKETIKKLIKKIKQGKVEALSSNHRPEDLDAKKKEFDHAEFGMINLQTAFAAAYTALEEVISLDEIIALFTDGPSKVLRLEDQLIEEGKEANFTLFFPQKTFTFKKESVLSRSQNSPLFNRELKGRVYGVINKNKLHINPLTD